MYWDKTITLFNRTEDNITGVVAWYKHVITNCFVKRTNTWVRVGSEKIQTDTNIVRIPYQINYLPPSQWIASNDKGNYITLKPDDIIIIGEVDDTINEYVSGQRSNDIIAKYKLDGVIKIKSVNENTFLPNKHYLVMGE